jgi:hypothetical protein
MTRRDRWWRAGGAVLTGGSTALCVTLDGSVLAVALLPPALLGVPLMVHGRRVGQAVRAQWRGHRRTALAIHAARLRARFSR